MSDELAHFRLHARNWSEIAKRSPFFAVLTKPGMEDAEWDPTGFFADGRECAQWIAALLHRLQVSPRTGRALDFGCGLGRLTNALADWFEEVDGVDIAEEMVLSARKYTPFPARCRFHHHTELDLALFEDDSFDFLLSLLVLQHMQPVFMVRYLQEFMRVLRPGGVAFLQIPVCPIRPYSEDEGVAENADGGSPPGGSAIPKPSRVPTPYALSARIRPGIFGMVAGSIRDLQVVIRNESQVTLPVALGFHYVFAPADNGYFPKEHRVLLDCEGLLPGAERVEVVPIEAPEEAGSFTFAASLVSAHPLVLIRCEPICAEVGVASLAAAAGTGVNPKSAWRARRLSRDEPLEIGVMQGYALSSDEVVATIQAHGGRVVHHEEDDWSGPDWVGCHYTIVNDPVR